VRSSGQRIFVKASERFDEIDKGFAPELVLSFDRPPITRVNVLPRSRPLARHLDFVCGERFFRRQGPGLAPQLHFAG